MICNEVQPLRNVKEVPTCRLCKIIRFKIFFFCIVYLTAFIVKENYYKDKKRVVLKHW